MARWPSPGAAIETWDSWPGLILGYRSPSDRRAQSVAARLPSFQRRVMESVAGVPRPVSRGRTSRVVASWGLSGCGRPEIGDDQFDGVGDHIRSAFFVKAELVSHDDGDLAAGEGQQHAERIVGVVVRRSDRSDYLAYCIEPICAPPDSNFTPLIAELVF